MTIGRKSKRNVQNVRETVLERDGRVCVAAETHWAMSHPCGGIMTLQHRVTRGMGSSARYDAEPYLVAMCAIHNALEPADADFRTYSEQMGWSIPRWAAEQNPINRIPARFHDGWFLLDGQKKFEIPASVALDLMNEIYGTE